jgi:tetratricopeptide (TPR) repeat protein
LGRPIPDAPELEGQAGQQRLLTTIVSLFHGHQQPVVLILEDLHWAEESLEVLDSLLPVIQDLPLLVVGSYRNDEKPDLPNRLPGMQVIKLERFSESGIEQLSVSMLGSVGSDPLVLDVLKKETEGNVFFLVEVVRALAERAGSLDNIAQMTIPFSVFAGGIEQVIRNRLQRMPANARPLLKFAAVAGRQVDLALLAAVKGDLDLDEWLTNCSGAAVLDVMDERWRFAHDKLREGLLDSLDPEERRVLHRQVAQALETVYADTKDEYAMIIADHYEAADDYTQALVWSVRAGKHSDEAFAPATAIQYYRKALTLWVHADTAEPTSLLMGRLAVYGRLGELLSWQARYDEAVTVFGELRTAAEDVGNMQAQAAAWCGMARAQTYQGDMRGALASATRSEELARAGGAEVELGQALWMRGWVSFRLGNIAATQELAEQALVWSKKLNNASLLANCENLLGAINSMTGHYPEAATHFERALETFQQLGLRVNAMSIVNNLGWLAENRGDFLLAFKRYQEALDIARSTGHRDAEMWYLSNLGGVRVVLGEFETAESDLRQVISMAGTTGLGVLSETYRNLAEACLMQRKGSEALDAAQHALELGREVESQEYVAAAWRVLGQVLGSGNVPLNQVKNDIPRDARDCFAESLRIGNEGGLDAEKARTLRAWAQYELVHGDRHRGEEMWHEAQQIFAQMGAELESERMAQLPGEVNT